MKIYKEIDIRAEMPTKEGLYYTNQGLLEFRDGTFWQYEGRAYVMSNTNIINWLCEIELPKDDRISKELSIYIEKEHGKIYVDIYWDGAIVGVNYILNKIGK